MFFRRTLTRSLFLSVLFIALSGKISGNKITDSLEAILENLPEDTTRALALTELSYQLISVNAEQALMRAREAINLSGKLNYAKGTATGYSRLALAYKLLTKYDSSFYFFKKSSSLFAQLGNTDGQISALTNIGTLYNRIGSFDSAANYLFMSLKLAESSGNIELQGSTLNSIGLLMQDQKKYGEAIEYFLRSLKLNEESGKSKSIAISCENLGNTYLLKDDYQDAHNYFIRAKETYLLLEDNRSLGRVNINISELLRKQGKYKESVESAKVAADLYRKIGNQNGMAFAYLSLAVTNLELRQFAPAKTFAQQALEIASGTGNRQVELQCYETLHKIYYQSGEYKKAYEYMLKSAAINDSLFNEKKETIVSELQTKYQTEKKENEILLLSKEKELSDAKIKRQEILRNSLIAGSLLMLTIGLLLFNRYRISQRQRQQAERMRISSDLHDEIGSTLSSISMYSAYANDKPAEAGNILTEISSMSGQMIEDMNDIIWAINPNNDGFGKTIDRLYSYASKMAQSKNIELDFKNIGAFEEISLTMEQRKNIYLICKEAINNAVKYSGCKSLTLTFSLDGKSLSALIRDDGDGFDTTLNFDGNGLKNMKRRAEELTATIFLQSEKTIGTSVKMDLPL